uniref:NADH dehydrogenase subunit 2 n=1 Tax=Panagrolaimus sp. PS1159 TaxID=55785 RepID=A0AC35FEM2_9BILA
MIAFSIFIFSLSYSFFFIYPQILLGAFAGNKPSYKLSYLSYIVLSSSLLLLSYIILLLISIIIFMFPHLFPSYLFLLMVVSRFSAYHS